jgi:anti-sigma factor RsiW
MTMHEEWTDQLSEYLDGELSAAQQAAVERHLRGCADCTAVLNDLKRVVARAKSIEPRPPQADLWAGIAERIDAGRPSTVPGPFSPVTMVARRAPRRIAFTLPQLAAAALVVAAVSGGIAWTLRPSFSGTATAVPYDRSGSADGAASAADGAAASAADVGRPFRGAESFRGADSGAGSARFETVVMADAQYDAAVADLEKAVKNGRGRLDASTIAIVEHNLQIIDQAISQAREALGADPANSYLSSHLVEARRRKLDLLRRAAALSSETN